MFTGIIEEVGVINEIRILSTGALINLGAKLIPPGLKIGDSVCVNGVCLTATRIGSDYFQCDVSAETIRRSNLNLARAGDEVNLERSLAADGRFGGHFVQGHVDDIGRFISRTSSGEGYEMHFSFSRSLERYLVYKGSIAINGISLTIATLGNESFSVSVIPHTFNSTNLNRLGSGDPVNLEVDILGKYVERYLQLGPAGNREKERRLTADYLKEQGF
ncbi:MAG TPA: riboflavin synthase [Acidobacteriota bacterium]|nr:riboflavin synthase [Acidobacteriota bacterium]